LKGVGKTSNEKIVVIGTGGTIASKSTEDGIKPAVTVDELIKETQISANIETYDLMDKDSANMTWSNRKKIGYIVSQYLKRDDVRGIVITHGSDTAAVIGNVLEMGMKYITKPVVITCAMKNRDDPNYDGKKNLSDSIRIAYEGDFADVLFCVGGNVFKIENLREIRNYDADMPFNPDLRERIAYFQNGKLKYNNSPFIRKGKRNKGPSIIFRNIERDKIEKLNFLLKNIIKAEEVVEYSQTELEKKLFNQEFDERKNYINSFDDKFDSAGIYVIDALSETRGYERLVLEDEIKGVIIEGFGKGHVCMQEEDSWRPFLEICQRENIPVIMCTKYTGPVSRMYEVAKDIAQYGVIPSGDWIPDAAVVRLAYINGHKEELESVTKRYGITKLDLIKRLWKQLYAGGTRWEYTKEAKEFEEMEGIFTGIDLLSSNFLFTDAAEFAAKIIFMKENGNYII